MTFQLSKFNFLNIRMNMEKVRLRFNQKWFLFQISEILRKNRVEKRKI